MKIKRTFCLNRIDDQIRVFHENRNHYDLHVVLRVHFSFHRHQQWERLRHCEVHHVVHVLQSPGDCCHQILGIHDEQSSTLEVGHEAREVHEVHEVRGALGNLDLRCNKRKNKTRINQMEIFLKNWE